MQWLQGGYFLHWQLQLEQLQEQLQLQLQLQLTVKRGLAAETAPLDINAGSSFIPTVREAWDAGPTVNVEETWPASDG